MGDGAAGKSHVRQNPHDGRADDYDRRTDDHDDAATVRGRLQVDVERGRQLLGGDQQHVRANHNDGRPDNDVHFDNYDNRIADNHHLPTVRRLQFDNDQLDDHEHHDGRADHDDNHAGPVCLHVSAVLRDFGRRVYLYRMRERERHQHAFLHVHDWHHNHLRLQHVNDLYGCARLYRGLHVGGRGDGWRWVDLDSRGQRLFVELSVSVSGWQSGGLCYCVNALHHAAGHNSAANFMYRQVCVLVDSGARSVGANK